MARLPDFVIIGSQRCGTTSLYATLGTHPDIGLSNAGKKDEIHYFVNRKFFKRGLDWYKKQFESDKLIVGEKSPMYLQHWLAPRRMKRARKDAKLIVMLRNPIDRAYSNYHKALAKGFVDGSFEEAVLLGKNIKNPTVENWRNFWMSDLHLLGFLDRGLYARQLKRWLKFYSRDSFLIIKSEDFYADYKSVLECVFEFVGIESAELDLDHMQKLNYEPMKQETRLELEDYFRLSNNKLYEIIGRDMEW